MQEFPVVEAVLCHKKSQRGMQDVFEHLRRTRTAQVNQQRLDVSLRWMAGLAGILLFLLPGSKRVLRCFRLEIWRITVNRHFYNGRNVPICDIIKERPSQQQVPFGEA